ncbi:4-diphosphocytidyl-2-C-methyl-D-erythritol kinase [Devosia sp. DBB001]|nr:4-diphosphocytidyl-2-C-methyl-D-erythritol kinase [Devosia sp. DBB001]
MADIFVETAPAKINLALHVTGRRSDGYHELDSLVVFADVADEIEAAPAPNDTLKVTGPFGTGLTSGEGNLVLRAVAAFRANWPDHVPTRLAFDLKKNLPVAAGLGGGSADAAAVLRLMASLGPALIPEHDLMAVAAQLGADVPMCLLSRPCRARGIGEKITALMSFPKLHVVLVNPLVPVVTADVFRRLSIHQNEGLPDLPEPLTRPAQLGIWLAETRNDLEPPAVALVPVIGQLHDALGKAPGCVLARMSGSGATVFGLFGSSTQAHQAAHDLRERWPGYWVAAAPVIEPD